MRFLNQVRARERLLAKGWYEGAGGRREDWLWNEFPDGAQLLRIDSSDKILELYYEPMGELLRVDWLNTPTYPASDRRLRATVSFFPDSAHLGQKIRSDEREYEEWPLAAGCLRAPPALAALGRLTWALASAGGRAQVISLAAGERGLQVSQQSWRARESSPRNWQLTREDGLGWQLALNAQGIPQTIARSDRRVAWLLRDYVFRSETG